MRLARRRRANKVKDESQLGPGDLVLAKCKGHPPWPAKISRPEDWKLSPDPKKYFVQFFGTQEIGFVAPVDIQPFTNEVRSKLSARCQHKTVKCFAQAVKEICVAFDKIHKKAFDQHRRQGEMEPQQLEHYWQQLQLVEQQRKQIDLALQRIQQVLIEDQVQKLQL